MAGRPRARPRLLVLGAGPAQLGLLEAARARADLDVIAVDRDPGAVGFALADERAVLSTEDEEGIDRLARARDVAGIVSPGSDWPVGIAARVADRIGLPHPIDPRDASLPFPCVVKAPDRQGQRGLALVHDAAGLEAAVRAALAESRFGSVLVEEHVDGPELTVNAFTLDGRFHALAVTDRLTAEPPAFGVALAHAWPSAHASEHVVDTARAAVEALGIRSGPSYTQLRLGPDGPVVMEVAARLGGGHDAELCRVATGVDLNALAVAAALGERSACPDPLRASLPAVEGAAVVFLVPPEGALTAFDGLEEAEAVDGVEWVRVYRRPGHVFGPFRRGADRAGAVLAAGADRDDALDRARRAALAVRFRVDADAS